MDAKGFAYKENQTSNTSQISSFETKTLIFFESDESTNHKRHQAHLPRFLNITFPFLALDNQRTFVNNVKEKNKG